MNICSYLHFIIYERTFMCQASITTFVSDPIIAQRSFVLVALQVTGSLFCLQKPQKDRPSVPVSHYPIFGRIYL